MCNTLFYKCFCETQIMITLHCIFYVGYVIINNKQEQPEHNMNEHAVVEQMRKEILESLTNTYGLILPSRVLWKLLGYPSQSAFRQSRIRGQVPIKIIKIDGRRGQFALVVDVVDWLVTQRAGVNIRSNEEEKRMK